MIVWGGKTGNSRTGFVPVGDGAAFSPKTNSWRTISSRDAPRPRWDQTAVWTGTEMIVWGGSTASGQSGTGASYNPASDSWTALPTAGGPAARTGHTAVWDGADMIVWGGFAGSLAGAYAVGSGPGFLGDGARYNAV
ncbi:MAG: Kelch repeat-containing protein, partial [Streptosporangiaceae bacterium]